MRSIADLKLRDIERAINRRPEFDAEAAKAEMQPVPRGIRPAGREGAPRVGAVLILLYLKDNERHILLTRRHEALKSHAGQISFPGGRVDEGETFESAAIREAIEEVGVNPLSLRMMGRLSQLYIPPSDFEVHPFVGWYDSEPNFEPSPDEVAELLEVCLTDLLLPDVRQTETWTIRGYKVKVPYFQVDEHKVWGATAMMLSEFLGRLEAEIKLING